MNNDTANENLEDLAAEIKRQDTKILADKYCKKPCGDYFCPRCGEPATVAVNPTTQNSELVCTANTKHNFHNVALVLWCEKLFPNSEGIAAAVEIASNIFGLTPNSPQKIENATNEKFYMPKIAFNAEGIPREMWRIARWVMWKLQHKKGNPKKFEKIPFSVSENSGDTFFKADPTQKKNWLTFVTVQRAYKRLKEFSGVGFVLSSSDDICCVDLDNCFNADGTLNDLAKDVLSICGNSYAEKSQSGDGVHIFFSDREFEENRKGIIEIYGDRRFIAVTGEKINDTSEILNVDGACKKLVEKYFGEKIKHSGELPPLCFENLDVLDSVERIAINYFQSEKCKQNDTNAFDLFNGNIDAYFERRKNSAYVANDESHSAADVDLMLKIFFYVGDSADDSKSKERVLKVFSKSALAVRDKWQNRDDYKTRTLQQAFNFWVSNGKKTLARKATDDFDAISDDVTFFDGLEKIKPTAGTILQVIPAEHRAALNALFCNKNFSEFQNLIPEPEKYLLWLAETLNTFFDNPAELKNFISEKLKKCNVPLQDFAVNFSDEKKFDFTQHFKIQLEQFAKHSPHVKNSLLRLSYKDTKNFLYKSFTDLECAEFLIDLQADFLRYDVLQDDWYIWNKNKWDCVEVQSNSRILDLWTPLARKTRVLADFERFKRNACRL